MTPDEFRRSLDAFPLEYQSLLDRHTVIAGTPPFVGVHINPDDLRRACETQTRSHLIHLRQGWLQTAGHDTALADLIGRSAGPFHMLLSNVARLQGPVLDRDDALVAFAEKTVGLRPEVVRAVFAARHSPAGDSVMAHAAAYLDAVERLWEFVDTWHA
jgi:hypothetical protein